MVSLWLSTGTTASPEALWTKTTLLAGSVGRQVTQTYLEITFVTDTKAGIFVRCLILAQREIQRETEPSVCVGRDDQEDLGAKFC